jgi:hypothetical protein
MKDTNVVEFAHSVSRRRVLGITMATLAFLGVQLVARPVLRSDGYGATGWRAYAWAFNAFALLLFMLPIGGVKWGPRVRALVNDEISRQNAQTAATWGFGVAMLIALAVYIWGPTLNLTTRDGVYLVVTPSTVVALLLFAWFESRALRDG